MAYVILGLGLSPHSSTIILPCHLHSTHIFIFIYHPIGSPITAMPRPPQDGFKPKNSVVEKAFTFIINISYKNPRKQRCRYCNKEMDFNTIRLQEHLDKCKAYRDGKPPEDPAGGSQQSLSDMVAAKGRFTPILYCFGPHGSSIYSRNFGSKLHLPPLQANCNPNAVSVQCMQLAIPPLSTVVESKSYNKGALSCSRLFPFPFSLFQQRHINP